VTLLSWALRALRICKAASQDPCVYDVFAAAIHQARTGEAKNWWAFTGERKLVQKAGAFPFGAAG
jgi:Pathogenicity locus